MRLKADHQEKEDPDSKSPLPWLRAKLPHQEAPDGKREDWLNDKLEFPANWSTQDANQVLPGNNHE